VADDAQPTVPRTRVLAWLLIAIVPAFAFTGLITRQYRAHERALAAEWFTRAETQRRAEQPDSAVQALQNALRFAPDRPDYRFALGRALVQAHRPLEARAYLASLWEAEPGNGPVNLELGRLAVSMGDRQGAIRYYHNAIEGSWGERPDDHRRETRLELARFLIDEGDHTRAQGELIPLVEDLPEASSEVARIGRLLLNAGALSRARQVFEAGLRRTPSDASLLEGAGHAAFAQQEYAAARSYLLKARRAGAGSASVEGELTLASAVIDLDPFQYRLTKSERARRGRAAFQTATIRLITCLSGGAGDTAPLAALAEERAALSGDVNGGALPADPELLERAMDLAFRIEEATQTGCGEPAPADRALLLLERLHAGDR
jgi:tetratricopeptide (TPR) repeat protein